MTSNIKSYPTPDKLIVTSLDALRQVIRDVVRAVDGKQCGCGLGVDMNRFEWMNEDDLDTLEAEFDIIFRSMGSELIIAPGVMNGCQSVKSEMPLVKHHVLLSDEECNRDGLSKVVREVVNNFKGQRVVVALGIDDEVLYQMPNDQIDILEKELGVSFRSISGKLLIRPKTVDGVF